MDLLVSVLRTSLNDIARNTPRKFSALRVSAKSSLEILDKETSFLDGEQQPRAQTAREMLQLLDTYNLACQTRIAKIANSALDAVRILLKHGKLNSVVPKSFSFTSIANAKPTVSSSSGFFECSDDDHYTVSLVQGFVANDAENMLPLADLVVDFVAPCYCIVDENIQIGVLNICIVAATDDNCGLHGRFLLEAVKACFNIYLIAEAKELVAEAKTGLRKICLHTFKEFCKEFAKEPSNKQASTVEMPQSLVESITNWDDTTARSPLEPYTDRVGISTRIHHTTSIGAISGDMSEGDIEDLSSSSSSLASPAMEPLDDLEPAITPLQRKLIDCCLIFRALCKQSAKDIPEEATSFETAQQIQGKILSLELIYAILEAYGDILAQEKSFIEDPLREYICPSLVKNGVSTVPRVLKYSLSIFLCLIKNFQQAMKNEIGILFSNIFLCLLESHNSTSQQKWMVLQFVSHILKNPQKIVDLYINYDCDLESQDVFARIVNDLAKLAHGSSVTPGEGLSTSSVDINPAQELTLKSLALQCLVGVLKCLNTWTCEAHHQQEIRRTISLRRNDTTNEVFESASVGSLIASVSLSEADIDQDSEDRDIEIIKKLKQRKLCIEEARKKWHSSASGCIEFLRSCDLIDETPGSLARFLKDNDTFDKKVLGEFLGKNAQFNKDVLREFVDCFDFTDMEIDIALRHFLAAFVLPGEGQVVDRIMEYFGSKYYGNNPNKAFSDADEVYKLSFAIIMLATDLHNPNVKKKLTFEQWEKMVNTDLAMGLDVEYLKQIFDRIAEKPLELPHARNSTQSNDSYTEFLSSKQKGSGFVTETSKWVNITMEQMKTRTSQQFFRERSIVCVQPIFDGMWASTLLAFNVMFESNDDLDIITMCLEGFTYATHISSIFRLDRPLEAYLTALEQFTLLNSQREMKQKNILAIKTLMSIAFSEGNYLQSSWKPILQCMSLVERYQLNGSGMKPDIVMTEPPEPTKSPTPAKLEPKKTMFISAPQASPRRGLGRSVSRITMPKIENISEMPVIPQSPFPAQASEVQLINSRAICDDIDPLAMDKFYADSVKLSDSGIVAFVQALCSVSLSEISSSTPRTFSLQKIIEVAYYNMNRIRLVWSQIWATLKTHFIICGCHEISSVSIFAIDNLRQLAMKYLEIDEQSNFNFQKEFLLPFEVLLCQSKKDDVKDFIVHALKQIVITRTNNIKSGWKSILSGLEMSVEDSGPQVIADAFELVSLIVNDYYDIVSKNFFVEIINTLVAFGKSTTSPDIAVKAIKLLDKCAKHIVEGTPAVPADETSGEFRFTDSLPHLSVWLPVLKGMNVIVSHSHIDVRSRALDALVSTLTTNGKLFSPKLWRIIFHRTIFTLFENIGFTNHETQFTVLDNEWLNTTCLSALQSVAALFGVFFNTIGFMFDDITKMLKDFVLHSNVTVASFGSSCFHRIIMDNGSRLTSEMWDGVRAFFEDVIRNEIKMDEAILKAITPAPDEAPYIAPPTTQPPEVPVIHAPEHPPFVCSNCAKDIVDDRAIICPACESVLYCCENCQKSHWDVHSKSCLDHFEVGTIGKQLKTLKRTSLVFSGRFVSMQPSTSADEIKADQQVSATSVKDRSKTFLIMLTIIESTLSENAQHLGDARVESVLDCLADCIQSRFKCLCEENIPALQAQNMLVPLGKTLQATTMMYVRYSYARVEICEARLFQFVLEVLQQQVDGQPDVGEYLLPTAVLALGSLMQASDNLYFAHVSELYATFTDLLVCGKKELLVQLKEHFRRIGHRHGVMPATNPLEFRLIFH